MSSQCQRTHVVVGGVVAGGGGNETTVRPARASARACARTSHTHETRGCTVEETGADSKLSYVRSSPADCVNEDPVGCSERLQKVLQLQIRSFDSGWPHHTTFGSLATTANQQGCTTLTAGSAVPSLRSVAACAVHGSVHVVERFESRGVINFASSPEALW
jgi:hypothetical protein